MRPGLACGRENIFPCLPRLDDGKKSMIFFVMGGDGREKAGRAGGTEDSLPVFFWRRRDTHTHVHFNVGLLRVHVAVVVARIAALPHAVALRHAVHQMPVQLVRIPQDLRGYDRGVTSERLKRYRQNFMRPRAPTLVGPRFIFVPRDGFARNECTSLAIAWPAHIFLGILNFQPCRDFNLSE